jgi:transposase-like protein
MVILTHVFIEGINDQIVLQMLTEQKSTSKACREYGIKDSILSRWKQEFIERSPMMFGQVSGMGESQVAICRLGGEWAL